MLLHGPLNWRTIDLNLLVIFDAVGRERSVTRAAAKLGMTQTAISHALARLRGALRDELFVRTPDGMQPTLYAQQLSEPIHCALGNLRLAFDTAGEFDPGTAERTFTIAVDNRAAVVLAAPVAAAGAAVAPNIRLHFRPSGTLDLADYLDRGEIELAVGGNAAPGARFSDELLFESAFAALVRRGHPAASRDVINLDALAQYPHLVLSSTGEDSSFIDIELERNGLARRVLLGAPLLSAANALAKSDLIAILGERTAAQFALSSPLEVLRLPFESPRLTARMLWHRRYDGVPAHAWLRGLITRVARTL